MARIIDKERAIRIARKLEAVTHQGRQSHIHADIFHEGKLIATFSIRHGSNKQQGHDHISKDLHVGPRDARLLAECPLTKAGWIKIMREKGVIQTPPDASGTENQPKNLSHLPALEFSAWRPDVGNHLWGWVENSNRGEMSRHKAAGRKSGLSDSRADVILTPAP